MTRIAIPSEVWSNAGSNGSHDEGTVVGSWAGGLLLVGHTSGRLPLLVIETRGFSFDPGEVKSLSTKGFRIERERLQIDNRLAECTTVTLREKSNFIQFGSMIDGIVIELTSAHNQQPIGTFEALASVLRKWVRFWRTAANKPSVDRIVGLIGELLTISEWQAHTLGDFTTWVGPLNAPQDFIFGEIGLEVKTTQSKSGKRIHKISSLKQLDADGLSQIYLMSYRVSLSRHGARSIFDLVAEIKGLPGFDNSEAHQLLDYALRQLHISKMSPKRYTQFEVLDSKLYAVAGDFPRLIHEGVVNPDRIRDVKYSIDITELTENLISEKPAPLSAILGV